MTTIEFESSLSPDEIEEVIDKTQFAMLYGSSGFHTFLSKVTDSNANYITVRRGSELIGFIPYIKKESKNGYCVINSLPWYGSYGSCFIKPNENSTRRELIKGWSSLIQSKTILAATLILHPSEQLFFNDYQNLLGTFFEDKRILQMNRLPAPEKSLEELLFSMYGQKTRNLVRKSLNQGFQLVKTDEDWAWDFLFNTHFDNIGAIGGKPKPREHFTYLRNSLPKESQELLVCVKDGFPVAALLLVKYGSTVEYLTPVIKQEYRSQQPLSFLIHSAMKVATTEGYKYWNWGGTWKTQLSLFHFKSGFGAKALEYSYLTSVGNHKDLIKSALPQVMNDFPYFYVFPTERVGEL